jgi:Papain family cysteine protease
VRRAVAVAAEKERPARMRIDRERIPSTDPRLKRHVLHDSRSWLYLYPTENLTISDVKWTRQMPILDQGNAGACTAGAALGRLGTDPGFSQDLVSRVIARWGGYDRAGMYRFYSDEEDIDGDGPYPPNDNGSTGLTSAKLLRNAGIITSWSMTAGLDNTLKALSETSLVTGTLWLNSMFEPDAEGIVKVDWSSQVAGGHEYEAVGYETSRGLVDFANSWGPSWGAGGFFKMQAEDYGALLQQQGDVTIYHYDQTPPPAPPTDPVSALVSAMKAGGWYQNRHMGENAVVARAGKVWMKAEGYI